MAPALNTKDVINDYIFITWPEPDTSDSFGAFALIIVIFYNNQGAITLIKDLTNYFKTKYIYTKYCFLREYIINK